MTESTRIIAGLVAAAPAMLVPGVHPPARATAGPATPSDVDPFDTLAGLDDEGPSEGGLDGVDPEIVAGCAGFDHSDTDNSERFLRHFRPDVVVLAQEETPGGDWLVWTGTHWDKSGGAARVRTIAKKLGGRIGLEANHLALTPTERERIDAARHLRRRPPSELSPEEKGLVAEAEKAEEALGKRQAKRRAFAVTSKNKARIEAFLDLAAPELRREPGAFNFDRLAVACLTHTLRLRREQDQDVMPDGETPRWTASCEAEPIHHRNDLITAVVPVEWRGEKAKAERWRDFLRRMLPDDAKRRTVQQFTALGLLGIPAQFVMFHYGLGANGKSVFLETIVRILGHGLAVGLPRESLVGTGDRNAGSASPDLARLFGKRLVRILEVKGEVPLQEDLIKRLTGGEAFPVRTLFKGYFEFQSIATPHMSGNGKPTIDGTDYGIWRRMLLVHWDQTIPEGERGDFEEVVGGFVRNEGPGILAWLVEGAIDYLTNGLVIAPTVAAATDDYRNEMDPIGAFATSCVRVVAGQRVQAHMMYEAYVSWSLANAKKTKTLTKFGTVMGQRFRKSEISGRIFFHDCELFGVPDRPHDAAAP